MVRMSFGPYSFGMVSSPRAPRRIQLTPRGVVLLVGAVLLLVAAPTLFVVAAKTAVDWALIVGLVVGAVGLIMVGQALVPDRASFHGGTKIWQNDGLPGGGGGGGPV